MATNKPTATRKNMTVEADAAVVASSSSSSCYSSSFCAVVVAALSRVLVVAASSKSLAVDVSPALITDVEVLAARSSAVVLATIGS